MVCSVPEPPKLVLERALLEVDDVEVGRRMADIALVRGGRGAGRLAVLIFEGYEAVGMAVRGVDAVVIVS